MFVIKLPPRLWWGYTRAGQLLYQRRQGRSVYDRCEFGFIYAVYHVRPDLLAVAAVDPDWGRERERHAENGKELPSRDARPDDGLNMGILAETLRTREIFDYY